MELTVKSAKIFWKNNHYSSLDHGPPLRKFNLSCLYYRLSLFPRNNEDTYLPF